MRLRKFYWWYSLVIALLVVACQRETPSLPLPSAFSAAPQPSPSADTPLAAPANGTPLPLEEAVHWQHFPSYNDVQALAFAPDGALWAAITGGVVRWDLTTDSPTFYAVAGSPNADIVHDIAVTSDSSVWAATSGGVARFDGVAWMLYTSADGLSFDVAHSLALVPDGVLWAGGEGGLARFDGAIWRPVTLPDGFSNALIWAVGVAPDGVVWASTHNGGVLRYDPRTDIWTTYADFPYLNARVLTVAPDGMPWLHIGYDNVYRFNGEKWEMAYESTGGRWVCDMAFAAGSATPYIATCEGFHTAGTGLAYFDGAKWDYFTTEDGLLRDVLTAVAIAPDGTLAVGTDRGISVWQSGHWRALRYGPALREVTAVAVTGDGAAWFGFGTNASRPPGGGVTRFDGQTWQYFDAPSPIADASVRLMTISPSGELWAASGCSVLRFIEGAWQPFVTCEDGILGNIRSIAFAPNGDVWIASDFNVYHYVGDTMVSYSNQIPIALAVTAGGQVWLTHSTAAGGALSTFDGTAWITKTYAPLFVFQLLATPDGALWAAAEDVYRFDGVQWTPYGESLPEKTSVRMLALAPNGVLWAAAPDKLLFWDGSRWQTVLLPFEATVYSLSCAPDGVVWLGTTKGALQYRP